MSNGRRSAERKRAALNKKRRNQQYNAYEHARLMEQTAPPLKRMDQVVRGGGHRRTIDKEPRSFRGQEPAYDDSEFTRRRGPRSVHGSRGPDVSVSAEDPIETSTGQRAAQARANQKEKARLNEINHHFNNAPYMKKMAGKEAWNQYRDDVIKSGETLKEYHGIRPNATEGEIQSLEEIFFNKGGLKPKKRKPTPKKSLPKRPQMMKGGMYKGKSHKYAAGGLVKELKM